MGHLVYIYIYQIMSLLVKELTVEALVLPVVYLYDGWAKHYIVPILAVLSGDFSYVSVVIDKNISVRRELCRAWFC